MKKESDGNIRPIGAGKVLFVILMAVFAVILFMDKGYVYADWSGNMTLGANLTSGNTQGSALSISGKATQRVQDERYTVKGVFNYAEENGTLTARNSRGSIQYDTFITDKAYVLLNVELQKDKFRNLNLRTILGPGIGYQVSPNLNLEAGLAYHSEDVCIGNDSQWTTARLGMNYVQDITDTVRFNDSLIVNPSLRELGQYTARNEADLIYAFSDKWSGKLSHVLQYDSEPSVNVKKRDATLTAGLMYNF